MKHTLTSLAATVAAQEAEIRSLRDRVAMLEAKAKATAGISLDWSKPFMVGSPAFPQTTPIPPGTITC